MKYTLKHKGGYMGKTCNNCQTWYIAENIQEAQFFTNLKIIRKLIKRFRKWPQNTEPNLKIKIINI